MYDGYETHVYQSMKDISVSYAHTSTTSDELV